MNFKWIGPLALLAALVIGDQIRINRPGHKYRLTVAVETPEGVKSGSGILAITPDRGYSRRGNTSASGEAIFVDLGGGKNLVALLAHIDKSADLDAINYVAMRSYTAAGGKRVNFTDMSKMTGVAPVKGALIPVLEAAPDVRYSVEGGRLLAYRPTWLPQQKRTAPLVWPLWIPAANYGVPLLAQILVEDRRQQRVGETNRPILALDHVRNGRRVERV